MRGPELEFLAREVPTVHLPNPYTAPRVPSVKQRQNGARTGWADVFVISTGMIAGVAAVAAAIRLNILVLNDESNPVHLLFVLAVYFSVSIAAALLCNFVVNIFTYGPPRRKS